MAYKTKKNPEIKYGMKATTISMESPHIKMAMKT